MIIPPPFSWILVKRMYPITVDIYNKRADNITIEHDRCGRITDKSGFQLYKLYKKNSEFPPVNYNFIYATNRGTPHINLFSPAAGQYVPLQVIENYEKKEITTLVMEGNTVKEEKKTVSLPAIQPINENIRMTGAVLHRKVDLLFKDKESLWIKYYPIFLLITFAIALTIIFMFSGEYFKAMTSANGQINNIVDRLTEISNSFGRVGGLVSPTNVQPPPA